MGIVVAFTATPTLPHQRSRMADALHAASRCLSEASRHPDDPATIQTLDRAADRYLDRFNEIAAGRLA